jgi:Putative sensor
METMYRQESQPKVRLISAIMYLILSLPLGILYFTWVVVGLSLGLGTLVIWVGIPILALTLVSIRGMVWLERDMVASMLHIQMPRLSRLQPKNASWKSAVVAQLRDPLAWRGVIYAILKLPLGILSFTLAVTLPVTSLALLFEPLAYLLNISINGAIDSATRGHSISFMPFFWYDSGHFEMLHFMQSFIGIPLGIVLGLASIYILKGLAQASGELVRALLSPSGYDMSSPKDEEKYQYQYNSVPYQG